jgi:hypothetical protein
MNFSLNQLIITSDDFVFISVHEQNSIVIYNPLEAFGDNPCYLRCTKTLEQHVDYINQNRLTGAIVIAENIDFLRDCPTLEDLWIFPSHSAENFDYSPIYDMPNIKYLRCVTKYGTDKTNFACVDYQNFPNLINLYVEGKKGNLNYEQLSCLEELSLDSVSVKSKTLQGQFVGENLKNLYIHGSNIVSLEGIECATKLESLELSYNRNLTDISALSNICASIKRLKIEACGKIKDFTVLYQLKNLESLRLYGSNTFESIDFLKNMPNLRDFILFMNVVEGDLSYCDNIPYVLVKNRRHYNRKDEDFSKLKNVLGDASLS